MDVDWAGNEVCGQDFMAGTICSLEPGHDGPCGAICQTCGGDWINDTCGCYERCVDCGSRTYPPTELVAGMCDDCWQGSEPAPAPVVVCDITGSHTSNGRFYCHLPTGHEGNHVFETDQKREREEEFKPVTDEEVAEVFGVTLPLRKTIR